MFVRLSCTSDFSKYKSRKNFQLNQNIALTNSNYVSIFKVERSKAKVTGNENAKKSIFAKLL